MKHGLRSSPFTQSRERVACRQALQFFRPRRFDPTVDDLPSDWIDFARFHHAAGRHALARAALQSTADRLREHQGRFPLLVDPYSSPRDPTVTVPALKKLVDPKYPRVASTSAAAWAACES